MKKIISFFKRDKHRLATVALIFGFFVDIVTFRSLNLIWALALLAVHLVIVAGTILILAVPFRKSKKTILGGIRSWIPVAQQYSMGNLLSAFLVLYSASSSLAHSWPFLALVAIAAIGNEVLKLEKFRLPFQTSLFLLNLALYFALLFPVLRGSISASVFLISLAAAGFTFALVRRGLWLVARNAFKQSRVYINQGAFLVLGLLLVLYFTNLIPPIPLIIKDIDFYHSVARSADVYVVRDESRGTFEKYFTLIPRVLHLAPGERAYVYTAIFAPAALGTEIVHRWEFFDEKSGKWVTKNISTFPIIGGRHGGYRGYSFTENPNPGRWRISVETRRGQIIGRAYLTIDRAKSSVPLLSTTLE